VTPTTPEDPGLEALKAALEPQPPYEPNHLGITSTELGHIMIRLSGEKGAALSKKVASHDAVVAAVQFYCAGIIDVVDALTEHGILPKYNLRTLPKD
jgi:hypothetical protein